MGAGVRSVREVGSWGVVGLAGVCSYRLKKSQNDFLTLNNISSSYYFTLQTKLPLKSNQCSETEVINQKQR